MAKPKLKNKDRYGLAMPQKYVLKIKKGLSSETIRYISQIKSDPDWMKRFRHRAYQIFLKKKMPSWGANLSQIDFNSICYYIKPTKKTVSSWHDLPEEIKEAYDRIGIPEAEKELLAGVNAQYESQVVYENISRQFSDKGVIFCDMDTAIKKYPNLLRRYFGRLVPPSDNKFAALNSAVWSGGSFVYIPKGVKLNQPLQAYFRINSPSFGQFERTLIIADEGSQAHYIEGCTAPIYSRDSLHAAVVEVFVKKGARLRYTTVQNWSKNVYNLVTKRAWVGENAQMEWVDGNLGSKVNMKYPSCLLAGRPAEGRMLSLALASQGQIQDSGAKMIHLAPQTKSKIIAKSVSKSGGRSSYRGLIQIAPQAKGARASSACDTLILDNRSRSDTYPIIRAKGNKATIQHEATTERLAEEKIFYLNCRGIPVHQAENLLVNGFFDPIIRLIPLEYAIELNRLIELEMEGSLG